MSKILVNNKGSCEYNHIARIPESGECANPIYHRIRLHRGLNSVDGQLWAYAEKKPEFKSLIDHGVLEVTSIKKIPDEKEVLGMREMIREANTQEAEPALEKGKNTKEKLSDKHIVGSAGSAKIMEIEVPGNVNITG